jgi:hypothetical protein
MPRVKITKSSPIPVTYTIPFYDYTWQDFCQYWNKYAGTIQYCVNINYYYTTPEPTVMPFNSYCKGHLVCVCHSRSEVRILYFLTQQVPENNHEEDTEHTANCKQTLPTQPSQAYVKPLWQQIYSEMLQKIQV